MTPQEQQLLQDLTGKINSTVVQDKDNEAEQMLNQTLGRNPDALYIMAQTILVQNYALDQAKQQLDQAKQQLDQAKQQLDQAKQQLEQARQQAQQPQKHTSFLGNLLGMNDTPAPPPPSQQQYAPPPSYGAPQYAPPMQYGQPQYGQPQYGQPQYGQPQSGGFLRSAMQTATGVAAGALAFEGIESLMHGFEHHAGYEGGQGLGGFDNPGQSRGEVVNNYYGDGGARGDSSSSGDSFGDRLATSDGGAGRSSDLEDRRDDTQSFADANDGGGAPDDSSSFADDSSSSSDDNFDPGGNDDSF